MVELMLGSPLPAAIAWGPELTVIHNDSFDAIDNFSDPPPLGRPFTKVWPKPESDGIVHSIRQGQARQIIDRYWELPARPERPFGWFTSQWTPLRDEAGGFAGFYLSAFETTDRVLVERALLEREEQQAFVLGLSDALRPLADPLEVQAVACRLLGEHLQADYTYYLNLYEAEGFAIIAQDFARAGLPSRAGKYPLSLVGWAMPHQRQGQPIAITDVQTSPLVPDDCREKVLADRVVSLLGIPLAKQDRLVGALAISMTTPREWTPAEITLATEIGERTWAAMERARAEKTAREADIRLRTMADAAPVLIWDADSSGAILVNDHYLDFFGVGFEAVAGHGWQKFLHPEDAERHLSLFQGAFAQRHCFTDEARLRRADGQYRWLSTSGRPLEDGRFVGVSIDVTERRLAEERIRRNNAVLQAINLVFSETLGASSEEELARISLDVAEELTGSAIGFMGEIDKTTGRLDGLFFSDRSRARYAARTSDGDDRFPMGKSALGLAIHGIYGRVLQDGAGIIVNDPASHPDRVGTPAGHLPLTAFLGVPLKQGDRTRGMIGLGNRPGGYRSEDLEAAEALAPAIWHALRSKRAELRLRESEERFRQFAEASSDVLWIRDAETLAMEYVSPALRTVYGIEPSLLGTDIRRWASHMLPEDREHALQNLQRAATGQSLLNEFRIQRPSDGAFRWIRSTLFPLRDEQGRVRRIGGLSSDMTEAKLLVDHQAVLLAELQHRVRNIMAVTRSIVARTGERAETVSDYASLVGGRLLSLARVQALLTRSPNAGVLVATIVRDEIDAQDLRADQYDLSGPKVELSPKAAEILTLAVHELATNALKYGALSVSEGRVRVRWSLFEKKGESWLGFDWAEDGVPKAKIAAEREANGRTGARRGFGRELIEGRLPYELGGRGRLEIGPEGARCRLEFPLRVGASILETDAPQRATVFGGALDMTGQPDLSGYRILVVEDDYYLATDTARALQGAGAEVVGPCPSEEAAREALDEGALAAALVDINLGSGPSFTLAALLRERGVPFVFITGYDEGVIPPDFADVERLQKPVELKRVVNFLAEALHAVP